MIPEKLLPFYRDLCERIGIQSDGAEGIRSSSDTLVPHPLLRRTLQNDPAMAAILEGSNVHFALGNLDDAPFVFLERRLIQLSSTLIFDPAALSAAARWGLEAHDLREAGTEVTRRDLLGLARFGVALIGQLEESSRACFMSVIPEAVRDELLSEAPVDQPAERFLGWLARLAKAGPQKANGNEGNPSELHFPVERILVRGGDSRLTIDPRTGCNRYGVPPRPRPEAVHFSSSTASAVTDYGFLFCDLLRRDLMAAIRGGQCTECELKAQVVDAIGGGILDLFGLDGSISDLAVTPSGTDAELLAVLVARCGAQGRPLVNVLIAPEESGSGVPVAASGCYFDDVAATGVHVARGTPVWPDADIATRAIPVRDRDGTALARDRVNREFLAVSRTALQESNHLLVHVLLSSKTDLYAPDLEAVAELVAEAPERVDVVVDACQLRADFASLGALVRRGWMVQLSGSKFLTGPPFSGALVVPASLRSRAAAIVEGLLQAPGIGSPADWAAEWRSRLGKSAPATSYGPLFRWLPALLEAKLFFELPDDFRFEIAARFRNALTERMRRSNYLQPLTLAEGSAGGTDQTVAHSILSFVVLGGREDAPPVPLSKGECKRLFELLNRDVSSMLQPLAPGEEALARQPVHIGQPVTLGFDGTAITVLRLVLGARFFTIVGHREPESRAAALESEIADAERAIAKVELLARYWWRLG